MACFSHLPLFDAPTRGDPLEFRDETYPAKLKGWYLWRKFHNRHNFITVLYYTPV